MFGLRRQWLVNYTFNGGTGRVFITSKRLRLTDRLILEMDEWLKIDDPTLKNPTVKSAVPIGWVYTKEQSK